MKKELWRDSITKGKYLELQNIRLEWWYNYEVCNRVGWKNAVAWFITHIKNQTYIIIKQYRYPLQKYIIELVAWVIDKDISQEDILKYEVIEESWALPVASGTLFTAQ